MERPAVLLCCLPCLGACCKFCPAHERHAQGRCGKGGMSPLPLPSCPWALLPSCLSWPSQLVLLMVLLGRWLSRKVVSCLLLTSNRWSDLGLLSPGLSKVKGAGGSSSERGDGWVPPVLGDARWAPARLKVISFWQHQHLGCSATVAGQVIHALKMETFGRFSGRQSWSFQ